MNNKKILNKKSKFLSLVLRHNPSAANLRLNENGWAKVVDILQNMQMTFNDLSSIVVNNDKKRFEFNSDYTEIRARQGHSIDVDVELKEFIPMAYLYHGTAKKHLDSILKNGLNKQKRNHVHLSDNEQTAAQVGSRHGETRLLKVDAIQMYKDGFKFFKSNNDVYLTDNVPVKYLTIINNQ